ncbi:MAG: exosortase-associated EpsI family protein [Sedimentisphaerales bacterium]|nr:exosortase-associated EpsI family protein [Sedimentisphaerales bacterium]
MWLVWLLSVVLLVSAGIAYRVPAKRIRLLGEEPIKLSVPLSEFPMQVSGWAGTELSIRSTTREYMEDNFADDFFSRRYVNSDTNTWADVYVVYCASRPGGILGHRPRVCYRAHGWQHEGTKTMQFESKGGRHIDCLMHQFYKAPPDYGRMIVLSFYVVNGQVTASERGFSGPLGRRPNIARDPRRYVAQVQISSVLQESVEAAARDMADMILQFLPSKGGEKGMEKLADVEKGR